MNSFSFVIGKLENRLAKTWNPTHHYLAITVGFHYVYVFSYFYYVCILIFIFSLKKMEHCSSVLSNTTFCDEVSVL